MLVSSSASLFYVLVLGTSHLFAAGPPVTGEPASTLPAPGIPRIAEQVSSAGIASPHAVSNAPALGAPIDVELLGGLRGGDSTVDNDVTISGVVDGNTAEGIVSGSNVLGGGAFDNASGINTVIQNTGSNVLIQNGMVVNVQFVPPVP